MKFLLTLFILSFSFVNAIEYPLNNDPIDVVIPCHAKDLSLLDMCIDGIRKNGENIRNVYVISKERLTDKAEWVDESQFPFTKLIVTDKIFGRKLSKLINNYCSEKGGWVYQQLLKFYAFQIIPELSSNVLILDSDTLFLNPVSFLTAEGRPLINQIAHREIEGVYTNYILNFLPTKSSYERSAITHHMIFQRPVIENLFSVVEEYHRVPFWEAFCKCTHFTIPDKKSRIPSEYMIYLDFFLSNSEKPILRELKWVDMSDPARIPEFQELGYHYVSIHSYLRNKFIKNLLFKNHI